MLRCLALIVMLVAACSAAGSPGPTILPGPSGGGTLSSAELRLRLIDQLGPRWYCDPDFYPIAVNDEMTRMRTRWAEVLADGECRLGVGGSGLDLRPVADDPGVVQEPIDVTGFESSDRVRIEFLERLPVPLALAEDRDPRQPGLGALQREHLE